MFGRYREKIRKQRIKYRVNKIGNKVLVECQQYENKAEDNILTDSPIWIFWWQGIEQAPDLVKKCIETIQIHKSQHSVHIVTKDNIKEYVIVPEIIMKKLNQGKITYTHFSDIVRMCLLSEYGGIWMDPTIYLIKDIPDEISEYSFYSNKMRPVEFFVSKCRWSAFFLAMSKENILARFCKEFFLAYWEKYDDLIDYYLVDEAINYAYEHIQSITKQIDQIPFNNLQIHELQKRMNTIWDKETMNQLCKDTWMFKLSWKEKYNQERSFYHNLIQ